MSTREEIRNELEVLMKRATELAELEASEEEQNTLQEKVSEAKAAFERLKDRAGEAFTDFKETGDELWTDLTERLQDARDFLESRTKR